MRLGSYLTFAAVLAAPMAAGAANFDGKSPVICATLEAVQCVKAVGETHECARGVASGLNVPRFLKLDFKEKSITATREAGMDKMSKIASVVHANGNIVLQGAEDGRGWVLVLEENTGHMTAAAVGDAEGMMVYGACTQL